MRKTKQKHGLSGLISRVSARGMDAIDGRSAASRALIAWRRELMDSLGGETNLSAQEATLVELCCRSRLLLDHVDSWLLQQPSLVNKRRKALLPVVQQRQQLADALARHLLSLGLSRRMKPVPTLDAYLNDQPDEQRTELQEPMATEEKESQT